MNVCKTGNKSIFKREICNFLECKITEHAEVSLISTQILS